MKNKPLILIVNDDGIDSKGISFLTTLMGEIGEVFVVAPESNRSGVSHAMTLHEDVCIREIKSEKNTFVCSGNPVDCVKLGLNKIVPRLPDLCVSGINHGSNHSINSLYSGTLHGAMEASIKGVPAVSFSHLSYGSTIDFSPFSSFIKNICKEVMTSELSKNVTLNINFPDVDFNFIKGVRVCRQGKGQWDEEFIETKKESGTTSYQISGKFVVSLEDEESDSWALNNNYISIVPVYIYPDDRTDLKLFKYLEDDF